MTRQRQPVRLPQRENEIETYLSRQCAQRNWLCWKLNVLQRKGVPDRMVIGDAEGVFAFVELKRPGGSIKPLQSRTIAQMQERGLEAFILDDKLAVDGFILWMENEIRAKTISRTGN